MSIQIQVRNKVAVNLTPEEVIVCGNSGYEVEFSFDDEWASEVEKTARFVYRKGGQNHYIDVEFSGAIVKAPVLSNIKYVMVGVYAGDLITTTPAVVECEKSILCGSGTLYVPASTVPSSGSMSEAAVALLLTILRNGVYTSNQSANIAALEAALASGGDVPDVPDLPEANVSQTGSILSIVSGVTATQNGAVLAIA